MIRPARPSDLGALMALFDRAREDIEIPAPSVTRVRRTALAYIMDRQNCFAWVSDPVQAALFAAVEVPVFSARAVITNHAWYAEDGSGWRLMKQLVRWADDRRLDLVVTAASGINIPRTARLLERLGLPQVGTAHHRRAG